MAHRFLYDHRGDVVQTVTVEDARDPLSAFTMTTQQDVEPVLDYARALADVQRNGANWKLVAVMPITEAERMMQDGSFNDPAAIARWANDSDNARLRVWEGRI